MPYKDPEKQLEAQRKSYSNRKELAKLAIKKRKAEIKEWFLKLKANYSCIQCGENHPACIEFHHRDPETKRNGISWMWNKGCSKQSILDEITKCDVLCSNCHQKLHWKHLWDNVTN